MPASLDQKRAEKVMEEMRDSIDVPASCKYGMNEVDKDMTKRMGKILVPAKLLGLLFQITPKVDNKMNHHITLCITTRADGKKEISIF
eukprot:scaffold40235_cov38-Attheya_sp.AAC.2